MHLIEIWSAVALTFLLILRLSHRQKLNWSDEETFFLATFINEKIFFKNNQGKFSEKANAEKKGSVEGNCRQHQSSSMVGLENNYSHMRLIDKFNLPQSLLKHSPFSHYGLGSLIQRMMFSSCKNTFFLILTKE